LDEICDEFEHWHSNDVSTAVVLIRWDMRSVFYIVPIPIHVVLMAMIEGHHRSHWNNVPIVHLSI
jgi:hypothetical protein